MSDPGPEIGELLALHAESCNRSGRPAAAPIEPDRSIEPVRFRRFRGAPLVPLPPCPLDPPTRHRPVPGGPAAGPRRLDRGSVAQLFFDAFGITGEARDGAQGSPLRANPSAGNLHPVEAYLLCGPEVGLTRPEASGEPIAALWHYAPGEHAFELRREIPLHTWRRWAAAAPPGALFVGLSAVVWRTAWKYGARAFRLALLDAGHALAALGAAAAVLGWRVGEAPGLGDAALAALLGLEEEGDAASQELPVALVAAGSWPEESWRAEPLKEAAVAFVDLPRIGRPNRIGPAHLEWPGLAAIERLSRDDGSGRRPATDAPDPIFPRAILHQRRSARAFDPAGGLSAERFAALSEQGFGTSWPLLASGDLFLAAWVHRVQGVGSGSHLVSPLPQARLDPLVAGDLRTEARLAAGGQAQAADALFVVVWLADLPATLRRGGGAAYRRLFLEAGARAHRTHLAAVHAGLAACPIGGFYDDRVAATFGLGPNGAPLHLLAVGFASRASR